MLLSLEVLAQGAVFMRRDDLVQGREEHGILARFVGSVHAHETAQSGGEFAFVGARL